jgi:hypothetical protein
MRFDFNMAVGGDSYVATFLDAALPNQATPPDLSAIQGMEG